MVSPFKTASARRDAAADMSASVFGSGIKARTVGSRKRATSSTSTPRPARIRARSSGTSWRWVMASARACPRSSSRSRQTRPQAERSTPRNRRRVGLVGSVRAIVIFGAARIKIKRAYDISARPSPRSRRGHRPARRSDAIGRFFTCFLRGGTSTSIEVELAELPVLGPDPPHRAGNRAHHHGLGLDHVLAELDASEQRAIGDAGGGEQAVALHHVGDLIFLARIADPHLGRARALLFGVEHEPALHLAADAAQRRRRQYTL